MIVIFLLLVIIITINNNVNGYNVRIPLVSSPLVSSSSSISSSISSSLSTINRKSMKLYAGPPDTKGPGGPKKKKLKDDVVEVLTHSLLPSLTISTSSSLPSLLLLS